jgi:hypothetical protein
VNDGGIPVGREAELTDDPGPADVVIRSACAHHDPCVRKQIEFPPAANDRRAVDHLADPGRVVIDEPKEPPWDADGYRSAYRLSRFPPKTPRSNKY